MSAVVVERVAGTFAGLVHAPAITPEAVATHGREIYQAFLDHKVLVFGGQDIPTSLFARFGTLFGTPEAHHLVKLRHPDEPTLSWLSNQPEPGRPEEMRWSGDGWHSDYSYRRVTAAATMLHGLVVPPEGGDTLFADAESAFAALPARRRAQLRTLRVRHQYRWSPDRSDPWARWRYIGAEERARTPAVVHPLVRRHPDTGRETLFLAPRVVGSVVGIEGLPEDESTELIEELVAHITSAPFRYRHRWRPLDVVVWDNRCLLHSATTKALDPTHVRRLLRLTTVAEPRE